ncbi:hypothetical protein GGS23DRAFT_591695 [Durotheca rogersii]|uniref:uncharacterized protein n=1 Tax=Durotheca rogersii TaxID=419775 RepID=UPI0022211396|nr:uncharacterized protein GGS23DRAFT_591695 [Durotheca rogersii]KAI5867885.1 hypothetical protein GGS23DRAFT_591695 [Durotheca rogersii]
MSQQKLRDFLVQIPDRPGVLATRVGNVPAHMERLKGLIEAGTIVMSGPTLAAHPADGEQGLPINGSALLIRATSEAEVRTVLAGDVYARLGVWDLERATVTPYLCAVRKPL